jgi:hypothetical protein
MLENFGEGPRPAKGQKPLHESVLNSHNRWSFWLAGELGFEPRLTESESAVLAVAIGSPGMSARSAVVREVVHEVRIVAGPAVLR